jgi:hypothetical protein
MASRVYCHCVGMGKALLLRSYGEATWQRRRPHALRAAVGYFRRNTSASISSSSVGVGVRVGAGVGVGTKSGENDPINQTNLHPLPLIKHHIKDKLADQLPVARRKHGRFISPWPKTYKKISDLFHLAVSNYNAKWNELPQEMNTLPAVAVDKELMKSTDHPHITWVRSVIEASVISTVLIVCHVFYRLDTPPATCS